MSKCLQLEVVIQVCVDHEDVNTKHTFPNGKLCLLFARVAKDLVCILLKGAQQVYKAEAAAKV